MDKLNYYSLQSQPINQIEGCDFSEFFESIDGKSIKPGVSVILEKGRIRPAKKKEIPFGIISSGNGIIAGNFNEWPEKYLKDDLGNLVTEVYKEEILVPKTEVVEKEKQKIRKKKVKEELPRTEIKLKGKKFCQVKAIETVTREIEELVFKEVPLFDKTGKTKIGVHQLPLMETYSDEVEVLDKDGNPVMVKTGKFVTKERPKINPKYSEKKKYVSRIDRPEWNCVGLLGQLPLHKDQPVAPGWVKIKNVSKEVELWLVK